MKSLILSPYLSFCLTRRYLSIVLLFIIAGQTSAQSLRFLPAENVAKDFTALLQRPHSEFKPSFERIKTDSVIIEKGFIYSEKDEKVPVLIYKPLNSSKPLPAVICLHGTGGNKSQKDIKDVLFKFTTMGIIGIAIDARYHGERVTIERPAGYADAIIAAWQNKDPAQQQHPFFYDTVYDLWRLTDFLQTRPDIDSKRIGMMGFSMGGIQTWMAASVDKRIKVAVPLIAAQSFKWSLENDMWQGRARTIQKAHEYAAKSLGDSAVTRDNVKTVWNKLIPGITDEFDCPSMIRLFAPRPLMLLNSEKDLNCPIGGAKVAFEAAEESYRVMQASDKLKIYVAPNQPHRVTPEHLQMMFGWFEKWL